MLADSKHKGMEPHTSEAAQPAGGLARAVILSAMLGIVLLATLPTFVGYPPSSSYSEPALPPLLGLVRGI